MASDKKEYRQALALLQLLNKHSLKAGKHENGRISLNNGAGPLLCVTAALIAWLQKEELVKLRAQELTLTAPGRAWLSRQLNRHDAFAAQQRPVQGKKIRNGEGAPEDVIVHVRESPLAWLRLRKASDGTALLSETQFAAGEKLRADFTRAQLTPRVTSSWDPSSAARQRGLPPDFEFSDGTLAAKKRMDAALRAVGPELSGVLLDICCFLKGLKIVEAERRWPPRTAKVVLSLALDRLAQHYGLGETGHAKAGIRGWGAEGYRPVITY